MKDYYWEEEFRTLLGEVLHDDYANFDTLVLFVRKLIDEEKQNAIAERKIEEPKNPINVCGK